MEFGNFPIFHSFILYFSRHMSYYKICVCIRTLSHCVTAPLNKGAKGVENILPPLPKGGGSRRLTEGFRRQKYKSSQQTQICILYICELKTVNGIYKIIIQNN